MRRHLSVRVIAAAMVMNGVAATAVTAASASPPAPASAQGHTRLETRALASISCLGGSFCLGVGNWDSPVSAYDNAFSQVWNGKAWQTTSVPAPSTYGVSLDGVSCAASRSCVAVGTSFYGGEFSDAWNGKIWRALPAPAGLKSASALSGVACPAADDCVAVGQKSSAPVAQRWNGVSWSRLTPAAAPAGATSASFSSISCAAPDDCVAVGQYSVVQGIHLSLFGLAESWNGQSWVLLPSAPAGVAAFSAVSCPTASVCVAIGSGPQSTVGSAVWNGTAWAALSFPGSTLPSLNGISCASAASCVAVGGGPSAEQWSGGSGWQPMTKVPELPFYGFSSVACSGPASCMAAGGTGGSARIGIYSSLAASWNGTGWQVLRTGKVDQLTGVSCPRGSGCLMVGGYLDQADVTRTLAQTWNGKTVRLDSPHGLNGILGPVTCSGPTFCLAAENNYLPGGQEMIATWNGRRWSWRPSPDPDFIQLLSCASKNLCAMDSGQIWTGKKWIDAPFAQFDGMDVSGDFGGLSCVQPHFCMATGGWEQDSETGDTTTGMLVEVWNGAQWTVIAPPSSQQGGLGAVSCVSATNCTTIGSTGGPGAIAAHWNGHGWKMINLPAGHGPSSISCPTATSCLAVGSNAPHSNAGGTTDVAFAWNGRTWRRVKVPGPGGIGTVSCAAANRCIAVGAPNLTTLAKLWNGKTWRVISTINP